MGSKSPPDGSNPGRKGRKITTQEFAILIVALATLIDARQPTRVTLPAIRPHLAMPPSPRHPGPTRSASAAHDAGQIPHGSASGSPADSAPTPPAGLPDAVRTFTVSLAIEYLLVAGVVAVTAVMPSLHSPEAMSNADPNAFAGGGVLRMLTSVS